MLMAKKKAAKKKTQSERFIEAARAAGVDESGVDFNRALDVILLAPKKSAKKR
jgi:cellobiose-specific phosphotransferase system component IIB